MLPAALGVGVLCLTLAHGGLPSPRSYGHLLGGYGTGCVVAAGFLVLAAGGAVVYGWNTSVILDRKRRVASRREGVGPLQRVESRSLRRPHGVWVEAVATTERGKPVTRHDVTLSGEGNALVLAKLWSEEDAGALRERVAQFLALSSPRPIAASYPTRPATRVPVVLIDLTDHLVTLHVADQTAQWQRSAVPRASLTALVPAKGPGEISLLDAKGGVLLHWDRYDADIWHALAAKEFELRALFPKGLEIKGGADA